MITKKSSATIDERDPEVARLHATGWRSVRAMTHADGQFR